MKAIKVRKTGNLMVNVNEDYYWITPKGDVLAATTRIDYKYKSKFVQDGHIDFSTITIDPSTLKLQQKIEKFKKEQEIKEQKTAEEKKNISHMQKPFEKLANLIKV
jgi:hypothetical protein